MTTTPDKINTYPPILTPVEVAELLQVPVRTLDEWRQKNSGPPWRKVSRHIRYQYIKVMDCFENGD